MDENKDSGKLPRYVTLPVAAVSGSVVSFLTFHFYDTVKEAIFPSKPEPHTKMSITKTSPTDTTNTNVKIFSDNNDSSGIIIQYDKSKPGTTKVATKDLYHAFGKTLDNLMTE